MREEGKNTYAETRENERKNERNKAKSAKNGKFIH